MHVVVHNSAQPSLLRQGKFQRGSKTNLFIFLPLLRIVSVSGVCLGFAWASLLANPLTGGEGPADSTYKKFKATTADECKTSCSDDSTCTAIEYIEKSSTCEVHSGPVIEVGGPTFCSCWSKAVTSGIVPAVSAPIVVAVKDASADAAATVAIVIVTGAPATDAPTVVTDAPVTDAPTTIAPKTTAAPTTWGLLGFLSCVFSCDDATAVEPAVTTKATCTGTPSSFDAGYGGCSSYADKNKPYCKTDTDKGSASGPTAMLVCPECGECLLGEGSQEGAPTAEAPLVSAVSFDINQGCCRTAGGGYGTYTSKEKVDGEAACQTKCAKDAECVAFELAKDVCEIHVAPIVEYSDSGDCTCGVKTVFESNDVFDKSITLSITNQGTFQGPGLSIKESEGGAVNGKLYVFGGFETGWKRKSKDTWEYNPANSKWTKKAPMPAGYVGVSHTANAVDKKTSTIYLVGGLALNKNEIWPDGAYATNDTFAYHAKTDTWSVLPPIPQARGGGAAVVFNNKLHFFNGASFQGAFTKDHAEHWSLDLGNAQKGWKQLASNSLGRNHLGGAVHGDKIYAIGGQFLEREGCSNQDLTEAYDSKTNKWTTVASLPIGTGHIAPATLSTKYGIITVGGAVNTKGNGCRPPGNHRNQIFFYNPATDKWSDIYNYVAGGSMVSGIIGDAIYSQDGDTVSKIKIQFKSSGASVQMVEQVERRTASEAETEAHGAVLPASAIIAIVAGASLVAIVIAFVFVKRTRSSMPTDEEGILHHQPTQRHENTE